MSKFNVSAFEADLSRSNSPVFGSFASPLLLLTVLPHRFNDSDTGDTSMSESEILLDFSSSTPSNLGGAV